MTTPAPTRCRRRNPAAWGELVPTYLDGLGCPLTGRSNELTKLVTP